MAVPRPPSSSSGLPDEWTLYFNQLSAYVGRNSWPSVQIGGALGPTWTNGTGAPLATEPNGSLYTRADGGTGTRLYVSAGGGAWNAVAGV